MDYTVVVLAENSKKKIQILKMEEKDLLLQKKLPMVKTEQMAKRNTLDFVKK